MKFVDVATGPETEVERAPARDSAFEAGSPARPQLEHDALLRVAAAAAGASGLDDVLELAADEARGAVGAASLSVSRWESESRAIRTLINVGELGPEEERYPAEELYPVSEYPAVGEMVRSGIPYFNSIDDKNCDPRAAKVLNEVGKGSDLGVPIIVEGETWGEVWATKAIGEPPFRAEDVAFLEAIAGQFATAIARAELFSRVSRLAYEDALTGLPNRRAFDERLERSIQRSRDGGRPLAMLLCDLDRLKEINDSLGHEAGDNALRSAAAALVAAAADRPGAFVARLSGDEFCVLLEGHRVEDAVAVGGAAIEAIEAGPQGLSMSGGTAMLAGSTREPGELLNAADRALYAAKRRGGAQVCSAAEGPGTALPRRRLREAATIGDPLAEATEELVRELDTTLAGSPHLDRLEAVASAYTAVADLASWTISLAAPGEDLIADLSLGNNRDGDRQGIRVGAGTDRYRISDYPETTRVLESGSGCFIASRSRGEGADSERELLAELGFDSVIGVPAVAEEGIYLIELYGDRAGDQLASLEVPLRLAATAAVTQRGTEPSAKAGSDASTRSELSLSVASRLAGAATAQRAAEAAAEELQSAFGCHIVHVVRVADGMLELCAESGAGLTAPAWTQPADVGLIGRCVREGEPVRIADVRREPQFRGNEATRDVRSELVVPIRSGGSLWGALNLEHTAIDFFGAGDLRMVEAIAAQLGGALRALDLYESLERAYVGTAEALSAVLEAKDPHTAQHSDSIAQRAVAVGRHLGMGDAELQVLRLGAAFHDIGKIGIPRSILHKPGPLTETERTMVEQHTVIGERILAPVEFLKPVLPLVRHAHERWDGNGYPDGLAGEEIPFGARVLFVCDAHDAMTTDRPYRQALTPEDVRRELLAGAGTQFDPAAVEALLVVLAAVDADAQHQSGA